MATFNDKEEKIAHKITLLRKKEEEDSAKLLAEKYKIPYIDLATFPVDTDSLKFIPKLQAEKAGAVVFNAIGKRLSVGVRNPEKEETKALLKKLKEDGFTLEVYLMSLSSLNRVLDLYQKIPVASPPTAGMVTVEYGGEGKQKFKTIAEVTAALETAFLSRTTEMLEIIISGSLALDVSDIHIEPQEKNARLRFRIDGVLYDVASIPQRLYALLLSRIKLISELKLNIHDRAQDGRFTIRTSVGDIEIRTSILPGPDGENIVLRILNPKAINVKFEELGMQPWVAKTMEQELAKPNGMILTTGPTGSGKTTTLYTFIKKIYTPEVKIITIEDPVEYHIPGIEQTQVAHDKGFDFANGLRAIVRQDPDIILVGEIRDLETAEIAMQAALTGHLVFSTLHTNDAAGTIPRLIDLGAKPSSIAPAINVAMAQRLVRRLCAACKIPVSLRGGEREKILNALKKFPKNVPIPKETEWTVYRASSGGCDACGNLGYKGRAGIYEIILIDKEVEKIILHAPSEYELREEAVRQNQITLAQDGILKVLSGITDLAELERVVGTLE